MMNARRRIFESVFPSSFEKSVATPQATPLIGTGSFAQFQGDLLQDSYSETPSLERSWSLATDFLNLPKISITLQDAKQTCRGISKKWAKHPSPGVERAIRFLLESDSSQLSSDRNICSWYLEEISRHYLKFESSLVLACLAEPDPLDSVLELLDIVHHVYLDPLAWLRSEDQAARNCFSKLHKDFQALVSTTLAQSNLRELLESQVLRLTREFFGLRHHVSSKHDDHMDTDRVRETMDAKLQLTDLLQRVESAGLGETLASRVLAQVMSKALTEFVQKTYEDSWTAPSHNSIDLEAFIETSFTPFIIQMLGCLEDSKHQHHVIQKDISNDLAAWKTRGVNDLGNLRLTQLFNLVVSWDDSRGAIEDLKRYLTSTNSRTHVINHLSEELTRRLLHPGASTSQILDIYIRLIQAFVVLDPRGVLLDRVARPIRRYLREREDTVKLIVGGLLADPNDQSNPDPLAVLALKLEEADQSNTEEDEAGLDWDDMNWMPDPVDAEPEYKKSKSSDVIGNLISLFETRDVFVKEFQNILGERLLQNKEDYDAETRLLELLKIRFGEGPLQSCEVMLRDVFDSARTDSWVKRERRMTSAMTMSTKILSRLFWPALHTESFNLPPEILKHQAEYSTAFEKYKSSRKLTWLNFLGEVTVELELEDRLIVEVVKTPLAALIYAFASKAPVSKTSEQLVEELQMDEDLVENCLLFWVGKLVLVKSDGGLYSVLERLPRAAQDEASPEEAAKSSTLAAAAMASATAAAAPVSALRSDEDIAEEKMQVYWQFIVGMLTNQGAMPLMLIVRMLTVAMAGGFPYTSEELRTFLGRKVDDGKLELSGGKYKLVKGAG